MLSPNIGQAGNNPEAEQFRAILLRLRDGQSTQDYWMTLCQRTPQHFTNALLLYFDKVSVAKYNFEKLQYLGSPVARISALPSGRNAKNATSDDADGLDAVMCFARGAPVTLTCNLWKEVGMCNGATGVVEALFYPDRPPPCPPIAALVEFANYTGPSFLATNPKAVPIPPHLFERESYGQRLFRGKLPLRLRYAMTICKLQGQTLPQVVVDLGKV